MNDDFVIVLPPDAPQLPRAKRCARYRAGHTVHYIAARKSVERGRGAARFVRSIDDDGWIGLDDGSRYWNHQPSRLRAAGAACGAAVRLGEHGILRVPTETGAFCFSVATEASECHR